MTSASDALGGVNDMIASAPLEAAYRAYSDDFLTAKPTDCTPSTTAPPPFTERSASAPSCHSRCDKVSQPLAFCGHAMPATLPRLRKVRWAAIACGSSLPSGRQGVQAIGKTPARVLPLADRASLRALAALTRSATAPATAPAPTRKSRRLVTLLSPRLLMRRSTFYNSLP